MSEAKEPFASSLCHRCKHHRYVKTDRSTFIKCEEPTLPKYPPQPVVRCEGFQEREPGPDKD